MQDPAFVQLLDMGIPGGRARAALRRSKGDVMSAAERVFAGEFDEIPSDDEGDSNDQHATGLQTPEEPPTIGHPSQSDNRRAKGRIAISDDDDEVMQEQDDEDSEDDDLADDFEDDNLAGNKLLSDPYAGIFFSKDRTEVILEPVEKERFVELNLPGVPKDDKGDTPTTVRILGRGEWMSGCPEGNEQSFLFQLYSMLAEGSMPCSHGCGHSIQRSPSDFFALLPDFSAYVAYLRAKIRHTCTNCYQITCLACGERVDRVSSLNSSSHNLPSAGKGKGKQETVNDKNDALLHCPNAQGVILGVGLYMVEQAFHGGKQTASDLQTAAAGRTPPSKKQKTGPLGGLLKIKNAIGFDNTSENEDDGVDSDLADYGDGLGMKLGKEGGKGTGYAGNAREDIKAEQAQLRADQETTHLLKQVQVFLPSFNRQGGTRTSDHLVHPTALAHLRRRSGFVNDLLRNDSLLDMSNRGRLYRALFDWLEIVSSHEALAPMLAMPQMRPIKTEPCPDDPDSVKVTYEGSASPRELLENCVIQAQAALKGLQGIANATADKGAVQMAEEDLRISKAELERKEHARQEEEKKDANYQLRLFCDRIVASAQTIDRSLVETKGRPFVERMRESLPRLPDSSVAVEERVGAEQTEEQIIETYEEWAGRARFQYCDLSEAGPSDGKLNYKHAFSGSIQSLEGMDMPKRSLAIAKELAILTTSLPVAWHSTIFLRVDETRVDVLKALIIGPEGTPYENGCFVFDIFLPIDYNLKCPSVKTMTTNGGLYRYNPNLYADGKVCLSLLGTWSGPGWISGQSTLLQVLISIQSLIFCEEPYLNEPGWASQAGTAASKAYSANVRRMTLADAMSNNIKNPPFPFEHEIKIHFRLKSKAIRQQIDKWKKLDDGHVIDGDNHGAPSGSAKMGPTAFDKAAKEMIRLLDELESPRGKAVESEGQVGDVEGEGRGKGRGKIAKVFGLKK